MGNEQSNSGDEGLPAGRKHSKYEYQDPNPNQNSRHNDKDITKKKRSPNNHE